MPLFFIEGDLTQQAVDALVNAANTRLQSGGGVCGAIFRVAQADRLQAACDRLAPIATGEAVITPSFGLQAPYIIHAVGPVYRNQSPQKSAALLSAAYQNALRLAVQQGLLRIAFPLLSSGIYGYPAEAALGVAIEAIRDFLIQENLDVSLVLLDRRILPVDRRILPANCRILPTESVPDKGRDARPRWPSPPSLQIGESLPVLLKQRFEESGQSLQELAWRANLGGRLLRSVLQGETTRLAAPFVLALALALKLTREETQVLLSAAGLDDKQAFRDLGEKESLRDLGGDQNGTHIEERQELMDLVFDAVDRGCDDIMALNQQLFRAGKSQLGGRYFGTNP